MKLSTKNKLIEYVVGTILSGFFVWCAVVVYNHIQEKKACEQRGGMFIKANFGHECVALKRI